MNRKPNGSEVGSFIVFEGIDGSGKSTQVSLLAERIKSLGIKCCKTKEPTDGPIGALLHQFMTGRIESDERAIAALFAADRLDHLLNAANGILEKIKEGTHVICDRYYFSSYAYHGVTLPLEWLIDTNSLSAEILKPTFNIFIDVKPETAIQRVNRNRSHIEIYENIHMLHSVREKYLEVIETLKDKENIIVVDGEKPPQYLFDEIWGKISPLIT